MRFPFAFTARFSRSALDEAGLAFRRGLNLLLAAALRLDRAFFEFFDSEEGLVFMTAFVLESGRSFFTLFSLPDDVVVASAVGASFRLAVVSVAFLFAPSPLRNNRDFGTCFAPFIVKNFVCVRALCRFCLALHD